MNSSHPSLSCFCKGLFFSVYTRCTLLGIYSLHPFGDPKDCKNGPKTWFRTRLAYNERSLHLSPSVFPPELLCVKMSVREKEKAKRQREEAIYKEEVKVFVMDEGRKQFAIEVVDALV